MRTSAASAGSLVGRQDEIRRIDKLTSAAQAGQGGALVLHGEAGIGKSALLDHARGSGLRVVLAAGSEFESELPFAALHQLCAPVLRHRADLPAAHREALEVAFGLVVGTPDLFRIGLVTGRPAATPGRADRPPQLPARRAAVVDADAFGAHAGHWSVWFDEHGLTGARTRRRTAWPSP